MQFDFSLATPDDDAELRRLLASNAMPGRITTTFEREPSYFLGCGTMGTFCQVIAAREHKSKELAGLMCRATRQHYVNGHAEELGNIGQLRVDHRYRGAWLLTQGLPFLHTLHQDGRTRAYYAAISAENRTARGVLVNHPQAGFPTLRALTPLVTLGIILRRTRHTESGLCSTRGSLTLRRGSPEQLPDIVAFLRQAGAQKQFFPAYSEDDFTTLDSTRDFRMKDFCIVTKGGQIVGVMGLWDQFGYKQTIVQGYTPTLQRIRPLYNLGARLLGVQPLPAAGEHIHSAYASFICTRDNDPQIFRHLLRATCRLAAARGYAYLMLGLSAQDPLLPVAQRYPHIAYHSTLYTVTWDDAADFHDDLDERIPYIEIATL